MNGLFYVFNSAIAGSLPITPSPPPWISRRLVPDLPAAGRRRPTMARLSSPNALHPCRRAFAGMTTGAKWVCRHPDSPFAIAGKLPDFSPLRHSGAGRNPVVYSRHSRQAGMAFKRWSLFTISAPPSWIPAFAGMTTGSERVCRHPDSPFAISAEFLTPAPRHLWTGSPVCGERAGSP